MTDLLRNEIKMLNLMPANKAAAEVLRKMGKTPNPAKLSILELAEAKANEAELETLHREDLVTYIPQGTSGEDLRFDLSDIVEHLTPEMAKQITEEPPDTDLEAEEMVDCIINSLTIEQWGYLGLRTVEYPE